MIGLLCLKKLTTTDSTTSPARFRYSTTLQKMIYSGRLFFRSKPVDWPPILLVHSDASSQKCFFQVVN